MRAFIYLIALSAAGALCLPASAQTDTTAARNYATSQGRYKNGVAMLNGQMMEIRNGQLTPLQASRSFPNGVQVATDGTITKPGWKTKRLREGRAINDEGREVIYKDDMFTAETINQNARQTQGYKPETEIIERDGQIIIQKR